MIKLSVAARLYCTRESGVKRLCSIIYVLEYTGIHIDASARVHG
jgi:hypothetical protein